MKQSSQYQTNVTCIRFIHQAPSVEIAVVLNSLFFYPRSCYYVQNVRQRRVNFETTSLAKNGKLSLTLR